MSTLTPRLPKIPQKQMTEEQKKVAAEIVAGPRGELRGPYIPLIRSPGLASPLQQVGEYLRFGSPLDRRIAEMATLLAARHWTQHYEWIAHHKHAMTAGLSPEIAQAIAEGRRPTNMAADEDAVYDLVMESLNNKSVCDTTYNRALELFGEQGIIDLLGIAGYYALLAMILNVARTPLPVGRDPMMPWFPH